MKEQDICSIIITWRGQQLTVDVSENSVVGELGKKLQKLTNVKPDTMKLLVPRSTKKNLKLITPFSDAHSSMNLKETGLLEGKVIRMMGVFDDEILQVSHNNNKPDLRIAGFEEEEKRLKQLSNNVPAPLKLPQGSYIFCDFRTLQIPGVKLNPPPSEALKRMHMLACDPGIIAIMNKYRWRVGVMTEMAPVGYVGISPKCILGFNKNQGEEISLRLRTDDLKGFRKYGSIKKTLLHELAHMVYSEHDADFFALDKQLNKEVISLNWKKSRRYTLTGERVLYDDEDDFVIEETNHNGQKLGGSWSSSTTARASSAAAAYNRLLNASTSGVEGSKASENASSLNEGQLLNNVSFEPDPDDGELKGSQDGDTSGTRKDVPINTDTPYYKPLMPGGNDEPDPDDCFGDARMSKGDSDDSDLEIVLSGETAEGIQSCEPDPDDSTLDSVNVSGQRTSEPDPDEIEILGRTMDAILTETTPATGTSEPDPDEIEILGRTMDAILTETTPATGDHAKEIVLEAGNRIEQDPDCSVEIKNAVAEPDPDDHMDVSNGLEIIEEPVTAICTRLRKAIEMLRSEATPAEATLAIQTLIRIIRNAIDHPDEVKFRKLRKANPQFQRNIAKFKAAMEVLDVAGFREDVVSDEVGRVETYMVLKRNDPGLLWLAKSSLEEFISDC